MNGVFLKEVDRVEQVDPQTGLSRMDTLEDERAFDTAEIERRITAPHSNRLILEELKKYADEHERRYGRFPKTLVEKITGRVDRPLQRIRELLGPARGEQPLQGAASSTSTSRARCNRSGACLARLGGWEPGLPPFGRVSARVGEGLRCETRAARVGRHAVRCGRGGTRAFRTDTGARSR